MKTSDLTGAALDWAVTKCEGLTVHKDAMLGGLTKRGWWVSGMSIDFNTWHPLAMFNPSTDWAQGGPIIEREGIQTWPEWTTGKARKIKKWCADNTAFDTAMFADGPTALIAAMRCYVASKLGEEVEVPDELA